MTNVELTDEDAALFLKFREYQWAMQLLNDSGFFTMKAGSITYHFNAEGRVSSVETRQVRSRFDSY